MNKLVIIGNGFDLAHELETKYEDFLVWYVNQSISYNQSSKYQELIDFTESRLPYPVPYYDSIKEFVKHKNQKIINPKFKYSFFENILEKSQLNWVDIEKEYFIELKNFYFQYNSNSDRIKKEVIKLNESLNLIKIELTEYLTQDEVLKSIKNDEINIHFNKLRYEYDKDYSVRRLNNDEIYTLNFNYTSTVEQYLKFEEIERNPTNYIHGKLKDIENPIIFGYGDETDENYEKIEKLNDNEFLKHMKSFAYLQTPNYKNLFEFLDRKDEKFEVHIMGHSCGLSDRLLFTHILEHQNLESVKIYYYEYTNKEGIIENDFFQKTQELSRYFRHDQKHKMRKVVVPFNESVPLVKYKPKE